tara:strand:+ start:270 stop:650 length:381 start_codon:yes stop_codon:yes gene_type:complete
MDKDYNQLIKTSMDFKHKKDEKFKEASKSRLSKIAKKKIQTTMIGSLSTVEKFFGFLWSHGDNDELTPEQEHMKNLFDEARAEILDRGNSQIRNLEAEVAQYDVTWKRYHVTMPVINMEHKEDGNV